MKNEMTNAEIITRKIEAHLDARHNRRLAAEDRYLTRLEKREAKAAPMIGELCREGRTVYYISIGATYREATSEQTLIDFLLRNNYVR